MSLATELSHTKTRQDQFMFRLAGWLAVRLDHRRTIRALSECREKELHDVGIIAQDIMNLKSNSGVDASDELCRNARVRSGNW